MLDKVLIREQPDIVRRSLRRRGLSDQVVDEFVALDEQWRAAVTAVDRLKAERNRTSAEFGRAKSSGSAALQTLREQSTELGKRIEAGEAEATELERRANDVLAGLPNILSDDVPDGTDERANVVVRRFREPTHFSFQPKPHWEIGEQLGILDFERAVRLARSRFVVMTGAGARLNRALVDFFLKHNTRAGFTEINPPILVNRDTVEATGHLSKFSDVMFSVENGALFLSPTSEVQLVNLHRGEIFGADQLPKLYTAYTPCFREEAGAAGKDTRGLIRLHQFEKVELVGLCEPKDSPALHERITAQAESLLQALELPYRVVVLSSGDTGFASSKTYDIEVWLPGQNAYREISSCSNCTDFQARRAFIRYRTGLKAKPEFVHTLNGSGLALGRTIVAILENYQQEDGSVKVPAALVAGMDGQTIIRKT
jgi:seryl-tRNA synthetase